MMKATNRSRRRRTDNSVTTTALLLLISTAWIWMASATPKTLRIGVHLPFESPDYGSAVVGIVDMIRVLDQNTTLLRGLNPNYQFQLNYVSTSRNRTLALAATIPAVQNGQIHAMAGDYTSRVTSPTALAVGTTFKMFMCSGTSTSSELSDKTDFPRFFRTIPDDPQNGKSLAAFVRNMGWSTVATIACTDSYGTSISTAFFSYVADFNITIGMKQFFEPETSDVRFQLRAIKESGLRVIMLFGLAFEAQTVLPQALELGMVGPDYVWIGGEGMLDVFLRRVDPVLLPTLKKAAQGLLVSYPSVATNRLTTILTDAWNSVYPGRLVVPYAMTYSECVIALARGLIRVANEFGYASLESGNHTADLSYFLQEFQGVTGDIVSFAPNGDRKGEYLVYNFREGVYRPVYQILTNNTQIQIDTPQFYDGTPSIPLDRPRPAALFAKWSEPSAQVAVVLLGLTSGLILVCSAYIAKYRRSQTVKQLSFNFLMLISLGCLLWILSWLPQLDMPTAFACHAQSWMYPTGISLILACSAAKAYRIWKIYDNAALGRKKRVTNGDLLVGVSVIMAIQWTLIALGVAFAPPTPTTVGLAYPYIHCLPAGSPLANTLVTVFQLGFLAILSLTVCFLAYKTRHVSKSFGESVWLFYAVQAVVLALCCLTPFQMLDFGEQRFAALWIHLFLTVYCVCFVYYALAGRVVVLIVLDKRHDTFTKTMEAFISATGATNVGAVSSVVSVASAKGKVTDAHLTGIYPTKRGDRFFSTWKSHKISVCLRQGLVSISPHDLTAPTSSSLSSEFFLRFHPDICMAQVPGLRNCIRLCQINSSANWIIQLGSEAEHQHWTSNMQAKLETASIKRDLQEVDELFAAARRISGTPQQQQQQPGSAGVGGGTESAVGGSVLGTNKRPSTLTSNSHSHSPHSSHVRTGSASPNPGKEA